MKVFSILTANLDKCDKETMKDWKVEIEHGKYGGRRPVCRNVMGKDGVTGMEVFVIVKDGCCL